MPPRPVFVLVLAIAVGFATAAAAATERAVPQTREQIRLSFAPVVEQTAPAVVNIYTKRTVEQRSGLRLFNDPFFQRFFGDRFGFGEPRQREQRSLGSGVILDASGLVVTNHHVIKGAQEITVVLSDRREFPAEVAVTDEESDLAVLRIDPRGADLPALELGDSDALKVGDLVLAIGNPFGVGQTVTSGIVSGLARTHVGITDYNFFIQTDAAINPGNSGGALVTLDGKLVGVNTAIYSKSGGSVGIGFAIPANMVRTVLASARDGGEIARPWLGLTGQTVTADLAEGLGLDRPGGVIVRQTYAGGPADEAGLSRGDVVRAVDGKPVEDMESLRYRVATHEPGGTAGLTAWRPQRGEVDLTLPLQRPPETPPRNETVLDGRQPLAGAKVANLSPALAEELDMPGLWSGVVVLAVARGSPAVRFGFRPGDVLLSVNGEDVERVEDLRRTLEEAGHWHIRYRRDGRVRSVEISA